MTIGRGSGGAGSSALVVQVIVKDASAAVAVSGELDIAGVERLRRVVAGVIDVPGIATVELDAGGLRFVDSAGLRGLLLSRMDAHLHGVAWHLVSGSPALQRLLEFAGVGPHLVDPSVN